MPTRIDVVVGDVTDFETAALVVNLFQGVTRPAGATGAVNRALDGAISVLVADGEIRGELGEVAPVDTLGRIPAKLVAVAGLGKADDFDAAVVRRVSGDVARFLRDRGVSEFATIAHGAGIGGLDAYESGQAIAEGTLLGLYKPDDCRSSGGCGSDDAGGNVGGIKRVSIVERDVGSVNALAAGVAHGVDNAGAGFGESSGRGDDADGDGGGG